MSIRHPPILTRRAEPSKLALNAATRVLKENIHVQPAARNIPVAYQTVKTGSIYHSRKHSFMAETKKSFPKISRVIADPAKELPLRELDMNCSSHSTKAVLNNSMTDLERQTFNAFKEYGKEIELYQRSLELSHLTENCLKSHEITAPLRAKMVDWMVEVLTNFKCDDRTFFLSISLMDRYFKAKTTPKPISELHLIGVTSMFLASKYEDILPLRMDTVHEKIAHKKLTPAAIRNCEQDMLASLGYFLQAPTVYEFTKRYCKQVIGGALCDFLAPADKELVEKMAIYLTKMCSHDYGFCTYRPSLFAIGALYVAVKICEQLKKSSILSRSLVEIMMATSGYKEDEIVECAQKVLGVAQNFDQMFPGLSNLKKT